MLLHIPDVLTAAEVKDVRETLDMIVRAFGQ